MPAIAFLVVSFLCGFEITKRMKVNICGQIAAGIGSGYLMSGLITKRMKVNIWGRIAAGIGIGYLISGWIVYIVSYFSKVVLGLTHEALCQSIFTLRPDNPEGLPCYRTLFILFPAWGGHSQSHLLFMLCSFKFNSAVHHCNLIAYYVLF